MKTVRGDSVKFFCSQCGQEGIPVYRQLSQGREPGHLKKMFCLYCGKEHNHVEVRPEGKSAYTYKDFLIEYNWGNFSEDGTRKVESYRQFEAKVRKFLEKNPTGSKEELWNENIRNN